MVTELNIYLAFGCTFFVLLAAIRLVSNLNN